MRRLLTVGLVVSLSSLAFATDDLDTGNGRPAVRRAVKRSREYGELVAAQVLKHDVVAGFRC